MEKRELHFPDGRFLHGGDYNPEQWLDRPDILEEDIRMLKQAGCNAVTLGVFSWAVLEPEEGKYNFGWLSDVMNKLYENGIYIILATPSGARPRWLAEKYPEVLRVDRQRRRALFGERHNHCYTAPAYRDKVVQIDTKLAETFGNHPGILLWHISNEYGGECHCPLCQEAFRKWVEDRYKTIDEVNKRWYATFWSHSYQHFGQIESPSSIGDFSFHGLNLDWMRFVTDQTTDFMKTEIQALRDAGVKAPVTTNLMYYFEFLDYHKLAKHIDIVSWDNYPKWHSHSEIETAEDCGMCHDLMRSLKHQPFLLMENSPSMTNWQSISKLKKPGLHKLTALQAIGHGSDSVLYFQIRQSRGASEKFHGSMIDHSGKEDARTYQEVVKTGQALEQISEIRGADNPAQVAIIYDWNNLWAMKDAQGPRNKNLYYKEAVLKAYHGFKRQGMNVDIIEPEDNLEHYKIVVAPMLYLMEESTGEKIKSYVEQGGTFLMTYWSGIVNENDLCYLGSRPYGLEDVFGISSREIDALRDEEVNTLLPTDAFKNPTNEVYMCHNLCDLVDEKGAQVLATYGMDFYAGKPACTKNKYGKGYAYYLCTDVEQMFYDDLCKDMVEVSGITEKVSFFVPDHVEVNIRKKDEFYYTFVHNFSNYETEIAIDGTDNMLLLGSDIKKLAPFETIVLKTQTLL